ncbi:fibronectin type III domain-containing protein [Hymenobacter rubidus]|uniref:fibronectin type III domain-containing protein n=1 Tax=Hymenobacter rubidus TaxID=1441626 RepID=UPI001F02AF01|nr:fibronectin type III domain-containing protein [Hymenobacter rubidus]
MTSTATLVTFRTLAVPTVCGAVTNVVVTGTSATSATVTFTPGAGNTSFHITYYILNDSTRWVNTTSSPATLTGLVPGQTYYIQVTSVCGTGTTVVYTGGGQITFSFRGALAARDALGAGAVSIYPNPAHRAAGLVLPAVPGVAQASLGLFNAVGQQVRAAVVPLASGLETRTQLDLSGIAPGLYTLRVQAGSQVASQRLSVE